MAIKLSIVDLIAPQFLSGLQLPADFQNYLGIMGVDQCETFYTGDTIVYTGQATLDSSGVLNPVTQVASPNGSNFSWDTPKIHFRMMIPRNGARFIHDAVTDNPGGNVNLTQASALLADLLPAAGVAAMEDETLVADYPEVSFRIEILIDVLNFTLGAEWKPGQISSADRRVVIDPARSSERVKIRLPKVLLSYHQGDDPNDLKPELRLESWGVTAFDMAKDLGMGELIRMDPPIAVYENEKIAFSIDRVIIDTSTEATPAEILQHFGVDEEWTGLYIGQMLIFFNNEQGVGFNFRIKDALISFKGEVSLEAALDIYLNVSVGSMTVNPKFYNGSEPVTEYVAGKISPAVTSAPSAEPGGRVTLKQGAVMHLEIQGGTPAYTINVLQNGSNIWDSGNRRAVFNTPGTYNVFISVTDSSTGAGSPRRSSEYLAVTVQAAADAAAPQDGMPSDRSASQASLQPLDAVVVNGNQSDRRLLVTEAGSSIRLEVQGPGDFSVNVSGTRAGSTITPLSFAGQRIINLEVPDNSNLAVTVDFQGSTGGELSEKPEIRFYYAKPGQSDSQVNAYIDYATQTNSSLPNSDMHFQSTVQSFRNFIGSSPDISRLNGIQLDAWASNDPSNAANDLALSERRKRVVEAIVRHYLNGVPITRSDHHGHASSPHPGEVFDPSNPNYTNDENRTVRITLTANAEAGHQISTTLSRPAPPASTTPAVPTPTSPPAAPEMPNDVPPVIKQLGIRIKLERNRLSLLELYGKIDIETELEKKLRTETGDSGGTLDMSHGNQNDGVIDFTLTYTYDQATRENGLILNIHSDERDIDGLAHMDNNANRDDIFKNIFGAVLLFAPIINASATAVGRDTKDVGAWVGLGASLAVPIAIGGLNVFRTRRVILHGGEARSRWVNPNAGEPLRSLDLGLVFDYEVQFDIICEQLGIGLNRLPGASGTLPPPLRARYKAIGFNINYSNATGNPGVTYTPIFDSSKGYDLDLSDPSLFALPDPLGQLFSIAGARLARFNPVTLEIDFAIKVDLGIITVDRFKLKIPLDPAGPPQILPSGVRVNIPGVIVGSGFVEIIDTEIEVPDSSLPEGGRKVSAKGIEGGIDLTLVSLKIRIVANVGVGMLKDDVTRREAVSVFLGMSVEFPTPIILGSTGLGIYGFMGLFAMHYRRLEALPDPTRAVGPALGWLIKASGEPVRMRTKSAAETAMAPAGAKLWEMAFDRWSFGIGVILGTAEGGFLINLQGMLVLELPGPRILIMVKAQIITILPDNPPEPATKLETGIIGIVDIDFGRKQLTLGVMISFKIEKILSVSLPVELFFKWDNPSNWHLYLGTIAQPASANILDIVKGSAYLMIQGNELVYADYGSKVPEFLRNKRLNGIAIATGLEASLTLGKESIKIYLRIAAAAHLGVSFAPFLVVGNMQFSGELRLVIVSIGARGSMDVMVSKLPGSDQLKVYIHGEVCGSVSLLFFEIKACVGLTIGTEDYDIEPPKLVRGVYLQSFSPVLVSGQGTTRPIDASLGTAADVTGSPLPAELLTVPIDSLPVIQLHASPKLDSAFAANSFVTSPGTLSSSGGRIKLSDEVEVEYTLSSVTLQENGSAYSGGSGKPPSVWRVDRPLNGSPTDTAIDLATFSRTPSTAPYAVERSSELNKMVEVRWENACRKPAPPAPVLFTFCGQSLGISTAGWMLKGTPYPDPEGTVRKEQQPLWLKAYQQDPAASFSSLDMFLNGAGLSACQPAKVVGLEGLNVNLPDSVVRKCFKLTARRVSLQQNPLIIDKELRIFSSVDKKSFFRPSVGFIDADILKPFKSPYRTQFRKLGSTTGLSIREYMRVDFMQGPVNTVHVSFVSENTRAKDRPRIAIQAYNGDNQIVDEKIFVDRDDKVEVHTLTLKGKDIRHLIIRNRNFTGVFVEICVERIRPAVLPVPEEYFRCMRALEMPWCSAANYKRAEYFSNLTGQIPVEELQKFDQDKCALIFETGVFESALFYGAVRERVRREILVQELDDNLHVLDQYPLDSVIFREVVNPVTDFPAEWLDSSKPWRSSVIPAAAYLQSGIYNGHTRFIARIVPGNIKTTRIRFITCGGRTGMPSLYISVVQLLHQSEVEHHANVSESLTTDRTTLDGFLNDDTMVPLLKPDKTYRLAVNYTAKVFTRKKVTDSFTEKKSNNYTQTFAFRTDKKVPLPLSPYVLGTTPEMDENFHFYEDPLKVVFNDSAFLQMYNAYGKQLQAVIRAADGKPVANGVENMSITEEIPANIKSPYREAVERLIEEGRLPCMGIMKFPMHPVFEPGFGLKPLMPYTFDINLVPSESVPDGEADKPLFRRSFVTSRYANLEALVEDLAQQPLRHKALRQGPSGLPSGLPGPDPSVHEMNDVELENILMNSGYIPDESPERSGFTLLWNSSSGGFVPYALLVDATEPVWRKSIIAEAREVKNEQLQVIDPNFKIYENHPVDSMVMLQSAGESRISHFIRSSGGTRTLVMFNQTPIPTAGETVTVKIAQLEQTFYNLPRKEMDLIRITLYPVAPWE